MDEAEIRRRIKVLRESLRLECARADEIAMHASADERLSWRKGINQLFEDISELFDQLDSITRRA